MAKQPIDIALDFVSDVTGGKADQRDQVRAIVREEAEGLAPRIAERCEAAGLPVSFAGAGSAPLSRADRRAAKRRKR